MMKRNTLLPLLSMFLLFSCAGEKRHEEALGEKNIFRYNESAGISFLDPAYASRFEDNWAMGQLYNGLVQLDNELKVVPSIAKSWEISEDQLEYTFHLRNDVFFHDHEKFPQGKGRKVVAQDFVNSFFRIIDPETASPGSYIFQNLDHSDRSGFKGFFAVNDSTLKIVLSRPQHSFLEELTLPFCYVIPIEIAEYYGDDFSRNPVGTGPFQFKSWKEDVKLVMSKNTKYFEKDQNGNALPYLDGISVSFVREKEIEFREFLKGKFELISGLHPSYQDQLLTPEGNLKSEFEEDIFLQRHPWLKTDYVGFMLKPGTEVYEQSGIKDKLIRRAINHSINRKELIKYLRNGIGYPAENGFVPIGMPSYKFTRVDGFNYDPDKARTLLFEAGIEDPRSLPEITLVATNEYKQICEFIKSNLEEVGFKVKLDIVVPSLHKQMIASYQTHLFRKSWTADFPDGINFLQLFYSKNESPKGPNYTHFSNTIYDLNFEKAQVENDDQKRYELYRQMEEILHEEAPVIPLYYDEVVRFMRKTVEGLDVNAMNQLDLKRVKLKK